MREKTDQFHEKVIFLDVDGVLNSDEFLKRHTQEIISIDYVKILKEIVDRTNAALVLSSSWKCGWSKEEVDPFCVPLVEALSNEGLEIMDKVPEFIGKEKEISQWLFGHPYVKGILILDDASLKLEDYHLESYFLQTQYYGPAGGLRKEDIKKAIQILDKEFSSEIIR